MYSEVMYVNSTIDDIVTLYMDANDHSNTTNVPGSHVIHLCLLISANGRELMFLLFHFTVILYQNAQEIKDAATFIIMK